MNHLMPLVPAEDWEEDQATDTSPDVLCDRCGMPLLWPLYWVDCSNGDRVCETCAEFSTG